MRIVIEKEYSFKISKIIKLNTVYSLLGKMLTKIMNYLYSIVLSNIISPGVYKAVLKNTQERVPVLTSTTT